MTAYVVIESRNTWSRLTRSVYISCALGTVTSSGLRIRRISGVSSAEDAIKLAIPIYNGRRPPRKLTRRSEPAWHDTAFLARLFSSTGMPNAATVATAIGVKPHVVEDLTVFRNFYAHRDEQTLRAAQNVARRNGVSGAGRPTGILGTHTPHAKRPLLREWLAAIIEATEVICR